jgi:hypothetical protein
MLRRILEVVSVASILAGAYLAHPGLLLMVAGGACLLIVDRTERSSK